RRVLFRSPEQIERVCVTLRHATACVWQQSRNVPFEQSRNVPLHAVRSARHSLMRHYLASRPAIKAALRRPRRGLDGASPRCARLFSDEGMACSILAVSRTRGHFYFASEGDISTLPRQPWHRVDTLPPSLIGSRRYAWDNADLTWHNQSQGLAQVPERSVGRTPRA